VWNYTRPAEDQVADDDIFQPSIFAADVKGQAWSIAIWPPECSILIPTVDAMLIPLAQTGKASEKLALVPWSEVLPAIKSHYVESERTPHYRIEFTSRWPADVAPLLSIKRKAVGKLNGISLDEILDRELVEAARKA
jgi:hypothetical protein